MEKYIHTSPASDWFFVHDEPLTVARLAVWATREDGSVTGLIPVSTAPHPSGGATVRLVEPPPVHGHYKHLASLNVDERKLIGKF